MTNKMYVPKDPRLNDRRRNDTAPDPSDAEDKVLRMKEQLEIEELKAKRLK